MANISNDVDPATYANQTEADLVNNLEHTMLVLRRIADRPLMTAEDKGCLQYAHDVLNSIRNAHLAAAKQDATPVIVTAGRGAMVRAVSGLQFRDKKG